RVIDVAPVEVAGAGEIVELVAEHAIAPSRGKVKRHHGQGRYEDERLRPSVRRLVRGWRHHCPCRASLTTPADSGRIASTMRGGGFVALASFLGAQMTLSDPCPRADRDR